MLFRSTITPQTVTSPSETVTQTQTSAGTDTSAPASVTESETESAAQTVTGTETETQTQSVTETSKPTETAETTKKTEKTEKPETTSKQTEATKKPEETSSQTAEPILTPDDPYLTLVNKTHVLPSDFFNKLKLTTTVNYEGTTYWVETETLKHFKELKQDMAAQGITVEIISAYRSVSYQQAVWDDYESTYGLAYCKQYVAVPGYSEHHTGLAIDARLIVGGVQLYYLNGQSNGLQYYTAFHQKLAEHGFILRYLNGKDSITGYAYEPWHIRYVGVEAATEIMSKGLTLEEYLEEAEAAA